MHSPSGQSTHSRITSPIVQAIAVCVLLLLHLEPAHAQERETEPDQRQAEAVAGVEHVLDELHDAASKADFKRYFDLYASNAIFLGTDATERWSVEEFKAYARPSFDRGRGWTYHPVERHVYISQDGQTAWFDEELRNENLGDTRGTGALVRDGANWKIVQYNLTIPIPNELAREFVETIRKSADVDG